MFSLKEYTRKEYERDMRKLLSEKGLHGTVETYADLIESLMHDINAGYLTKKQQEISTSKQSVGVEMNCVR